jgi:hypothetical protein
MASGIFPEAKRHGKSSFCPIISPNPKGKSLNSINNTFFLVVFSLALRKMKKNDGVKVKDVSSSVGILTFHDIPNWESHHPAMFFSHHHDPMGPWPSMVKPGYPGRSTTTPQKHKSQ